MEERFHCPDCGSSLFHVKELSGEEYLIECYKTKGCKWKMKVKNISQ